MSDCSRAAIPGPGSSAIHACQSRSEKPGVYLAGPGVFRQDAKEWGQRLALVCQNQGLRGIYPLDGEPPAELLHDKTAQRGWIFASNIELIRMADAVFADLRAFRSSSEPDSGTSFEIGFAHALGKPVWLWLPDCQPGCGIIDRLPCHKQRGHWIDATGFTVEDFGAPLNLMLWEAASGVSFCPQPEDALAEMAAWLLRTRI